jgi:UDP-2,4-diacetamido-2,4,6-trideoxy-beta-L-altropyranose hydrolase
MKVFIVTEGGGELGFGHLTRCTSLYQAFEKRGISPVLIINGDKIVRDWLKDENHEIYNWLKEKKRLLRSIENADIIILDSYLSDYELYEKVSLLAKVPVYIDDNKRLDYPWGTVVNGTVYANELNYPCKRKCNYLLGSQYVPIRKEFWDVPDKEIKRNIETIMVTLGGDNARNLTAEVLRLLNENFPSLNKVVVIGKGSDNTLQIESKDDKTHFLYCPDAEGMKKAMLESDVAISAGGQTLYELARVGLPTIAIAVADNQMNNVRGWQKAGFIEYAGRWEDEAVLSNVIRKLELLQDNILRNGKARRGKTLVDGRGASRIVSHCLRTFLDKSTFLRRATVNDMDKVYELSNDREVRKHSFHTDLIDPETHKKWFLNKINNPHCLLLIAEINNRFLGQLRFDAENHRAIISISVVGEYRHLGAGCLMFQKGLSYLKKCCPDLKFISAFVKKDNDVSKAFFKKLNFIYAGTKKIRDQDAIEYRYYFKEPQLNL